MIFLAFQETCFEDSRVPGRYMESENSFDLKSPERLGSPVGNSTCKNETFVTKQSVKLELY